MELKPARPAVRFLLWFLGIYMVGNLLYGVYIQSMYPLPDLFTKMVSAQTSGILNLAGQTTSVVNNVSEPTVLLQQEGKTVLRIYEGCNGINVMVVFVAFVVAFGGKVREQIIFVTVGIIILCMANLLRIGMLYWVARNYQSYFYYVHKYVFTIALYFVVLLLWAFWVFRQVKTRSPSTNGAD